MLISASRRTDIPAFYPKWLLNRLRAGWVLVENPRNPKLLSRVSLQPRDVECIIFWSKNPLPIFPYLDEIEELGHHYYFQFTLTPYGPELEQRLPAKSQCIKIFQKFAKRLGAKRMVWRYDPIVFTAQHNYNYHLQEFRQLAQQLSGFTNRCMISFLDLYAKCERNMRGIVLAPMSRELQLELVESMLEIAKSYGITLLSCAENLAPAGVAKGSCVDQEVITNLVGYSLSVPAERHQRPTCGCVESVDIGCYDSCPHGCLYCYANNSFAIAGSNSRRHDPSSPLLLGVPRGDERISQRRIVHHLRRQPSLFS